MRADHQIASESVQGAGDVVDRDLALAIELLERFGDEALELWLRRRGSAAHGLTARLIALRAAGLLDERHEERELERFDRYRVLRRIGAGAMGVVHLAVDDELDRLVAIKVLAPALSSNERVRERFRREARVIAALHHPGCVKVISSGESAGQLFTVLEFVQGTSLEEGIERLKACTGGDPSAAREEQIREAFRLPADAVVPLPLTRLAATWTRQIAEACVEAHSLGVVHRDIKPSNVLIDDRGDARLLDFGLAHVSDDVRLTWSRDLVGTPRYLAPEVIRFGVGSADARADVHALGACLYELLTLHPAFDAPSAAQVMKQVLEHEAVPPSELNPLVPRDLDAIVAVAMAKEPQRRYLDARSLVADLTRFLNGESPHARVPSATARFLRAVRRRPLLAALSSSLVLLGAATLVMGLVYSQRMRTRSEQAFVAVGAAESSLNFLGELLVLSDVEELGPSVPASRLLAEGAARVRDAERWEANSVVRPRLARILGALLWGAGDLRGASELLDLAAQLLAQPTPDGHDPQEWVFERAIAENFRGNVMRARGLDAEAEEIYRNALTTALEIAGPRGTQQEATVRANLADLLGRRQAYAEAVEQAKRALELSGGDSEEALANRAWSLVALARLQLSAGQKDAAAESILAAKSLSAGAGGQPLQRAMVLDTAARLANELNDHPEAESLYVEAIGIYERTLGPNSASLVPVLLGLGGVRQISGDLYGAREVLLRALSILQPARASESSEVRAARLLLGLVEAELGAPESARDNLESIDTLAQPLGSDLDPFSALRARFVLAAVEAETGNPACAFVRLEAAWEELPSERKTKRYPLALRGLTRARIARARGDLKEARTQLDYARSELSDATELFGPADGPPWLARNAGAEAAAQAR